MIQLAVSKRSLQPPVPTVLLKSRAAHEMRSLTCFQAHFLLQRAVPSSFIIPQRRCVPRATMASTTTKYAFIWIPLLFCAIVAFTTMKSRSAKMRSIWSSNSPAHIVVTSTAPSAEVATKIANAIVQKRLAACVNSIPGVTSTYWWEGEVNVDQEHFLIMKTRQDLLNELTAAITEVHPYDTPMVVAQNIVGGSNKFLDWIDASTKASGTTVTEPKAQ